MKRMLTGLALGVAALASGACQQERAPNPYPTKARADFDTMCRFGREPCQCAWDKITRAMTYEEYREALDAFETRGVMDPRIVRASVDCRQP